MDRRSWLWRRKSSEKSPGETESSGGSISSHSERFSDDQVHFNQNSQSLETTLKTDAHQNEHNNGVKTLSEALMTINAKEELVKQHVKVAEEAVSGWEKAEREVLALRQQVEALTIRNSTLEDRVTHLDGALKECLRQLRQAREEKDQFVHEALDKKISETESSLTSIDSELYHKLETVEKENSDLKHELSSMAEKLELRFIEKELSNQAAEKASKQYLDSVKKVAKLEAECHRLNSTLQKVSNHQPKAHKTPSIIENGDLKGRQRFGRHRIDSRVDLNLMDDFLEMERLVGMPKSSEPEERLEKVESLEMIVKDRENELKASRIRIEEAESKLDERENELKASKDRLIEVESKFVEVENELNVSRNRLEEAESKLADSENELKLSRNRLEKAENKLEMQENELKASKYLLEEAESKLADSENELQLSRNRLEEAEYKLDMQENELKASKYLLEEAESKLAEHVEELKASRIRIEETESKLAEQENDLKAKRKQFEEAESKLAEQENELTVSKNQLEEATSKLNERENELKASRSTLEEAETKLAETKSHLEMAKSQCKALEAELEILHPKVKTLETIVQKEQELSGKAEAKCRELENEVSKLQFEVQVTKSGNQTEALRFLRVKQDTELAAAGSKFAECQKTIDSISRQLQKLATLDDFLIDTDDS